MREEYFRGLFEETHARLYRYARRRLTAEVAQEVVSDTYATLWRKEIAEPVGPDDVHRLHGLAFRILEGHMRNAMRSEGARARLDACLRVEARVRQDAPSPRPLIKELLEFMEPDDRRVLDLYIDGFRTSEIAELLGCSSKAAGMRLVRARKALQVAAEEMLTDDRR